MMYNMPRNIIVGLEKEEGGPGNFNEVNEVNNKHKEFSNTEKNQNPSFSQAEVSRCNYYGFKFDWPNTCPDLPDQSESL